MKDYLHLYLGQQILHDKKGLGILDSVSIAGTIYIDFGKTIDGVFHEEIKLLLRPLSDMSEEEAIEFAALTEYEGHFRDVKVTRNKHTNDIIVSWDGCHPETDWINATGGLFWCHEQFTWLLKKGFDIFGLIEQNLAIDKSKL